MQPVIIQNTEPVMKDQDIMTYTEAILFPNDPGVLTGKDKGTLSTNYGKDGIYLTNPDSQDPGVIVATERGTDTIFARDPDVTPAVMPADRDLFTEAVVFDKEVFTEDRPERPIIIPDSIIAPEPGTSDPEEDQDEDKRANKAIILTGLAILAGIILLSK